MQNSTLYEYLMKPVPPSTVTSFPDKEPASEDMMLWARRKNSRILADSGTANKRLNLRCQHEEMSRIDVLLIFGEPSKW